MRRDLVHHPSSPELETLSLDRWRLDGSIARFGRLERLRLSGTRPLESPPPDLRELPALREVELQLPVPMLPVVRIQLPAIEGLYVRGETAPRLPAGLRRPETLSALA